MQTGLFNILWMTMSMLAVTVAASGDSAELFNREIHPVLSAKCFDCHGPSEGDRKGGLRLDMPDGEDGALTARDGKYIIKPGSLNKSELWRRITTDDPNDRMPPEGAHKDPITDSELAKIRTWIEGGAEYQTFWSFVPPKKSDPPRVANTSWANGFIDRHVMARLEEEGLQPNSEADKRTLIRRLTFDLTGLPPTLDEIAAFLEDDEPEAYTRLVDGLLARDSYGEHMARYWADLVRLGDTNGMHKDFPRDFSTYRDWLIRSFNENLPFDDFVTYQLAGDLFEKPTQDQLVASGFNRLHLIIDVGTALPEESLHKNIVDRVTAFGTTFMGMTVHCAQCHDHKSDPITQKEYYQFYAFFNNFDGEPETTRMPERGLQAPFINFTTPEQDEKLEAFAAKRQRLISERAELEADKENTEANAEAIERISQQLESLENRRKHLLKDVRGAMIMKERDPPRQATMLLRGAYDAPGDPVERDTPAFLPAMKPKDGMYTRMDLAQWLLDPKHPLTARVAVNRFWQQFLGTGLVKTPEDFGAQGERPSHPALLDDLAVTFIESGWDVKRLVREIVLSNTYRQSSDAAEKAYVNDPENRLLGRGTRYRMDAEMIRDQILAVSGQLNRTMYGKSVKPPQPPGLWEMVSMAEPKTYIADTDDNIYRRSLYTYWRRGMPPPQMTIMNAPSREFCVAKRERTNTPLQALLLMNEPEYLKAAKACAKLTLIEAKNENERLRLTYEKITSHEPSPERLTLMKETLDDFEDIYKKDRPLTEALTSDLEDPRFSKHVELAAWTMLTHSLLNLELAKVKR
jgi:hypothetical protein